MNLQELEELSQPAKLTRTMCNAISDSAHGISAASRDKTWRERNNSKKLVVTRTKHKSFH